MLYRQEFFSPCTGERPIALSDTIVCQSCLTGKNYTLTDTDGLLLCVTELWLFRFCWQGKQQRISFGTYPTIDLKKARSLRQQAHDQLMNGIDPRLGKQRKP
ncbi:Arm DNA-binding domain-containing protein [Serratia microhaemolytica]|uniref:Arm DNA-binding domain-containing protein n=1 Tax=Serratia microhaemolytica TaxID=2675110 RepID=UPI000FDE0FC0